MLPVLATCLHHPLFIISCIFCALEVAVPLAYKPSNLLEIMWSLLCATKGCERGRGEVSNEEGSKSREECQVTHVVRAAQIAVDNTLHIRVFRVFTHVYVSSPLHSLFLSCLQTNV